MATKTERKRYATNGWIVSGTIENPNSSPVGLGLGGPAPRSSKSSQARPDQVRNARVRAILEFDATRVIPFDGQQGEQYTMQSLTLLDRG